MVGTKVASKCKVRETVWTWKASKREQMKKRAAIIIIIITLLFLASVSCVGGGGGDEVGGLKVQSSRSADATATFGAEQFHLQLTAISDQEP